MSEESSIIRQYREQHHRIAELIALGWTDQKIRRELGVSLRRLTLLKADPTFQELILGKAQKVQEQVDKEIGLYTQTAVATMLQSELAVFDAVDEHNNEPDGQRLSVTVLNKLSMDRADRFGYGKNSTVKVEHDLGNALERAIARSALAPPIDVEVREIPDLRSAAAVPKPETAEPEMTPAPVTRQQPNPQEKPGRVSLSEALRKRRVA